MTGKSAYDGRLQMFVQQPCSLDLDRLRFLRWLAEHGRLEHPVAGPAGPVFGWDRRPANDDPSLAA